MRRKVLQFIANNIIYVLENTSNEDIFNYYYYIGNVLDAYITEFHGIYLD